MASPLAWDLICHHVTKQVPWFFEMLPINIPLEVDFRTTCGLASGVCLYWLLAQESILDQMAFRGPLKPQLCFDHEKEHQKWIVLLLLIQLVQSVVWQRMFSGKDSSWPKGKYQVCYSHALLIELAPFSRNCKSGYLTYVVQMKEKMLLLVTESQSYKRNRIYLFIFGVRSINIDIYCTY